MRTFVAAIFTAAFIMAALTWFSAEQYNPWARPTADPLPSPSLMQFANQTSTSPTVSPATSSVGASDVIGSSRIAFGINVEPLYNKEDFRSQPPPPVELLLTDPLGRRLGYASDTTVFEIPLGSYFHDPHVITVYEPAGPVGTYHLSVIGRGTGTYSLWPDKPWQSIFGMSDMGSEDNYNVFVSVASPSVTVTKMSTIQSTLQDIDTSQKLGLIDQDAANSFSTLAGKLQNATSTPDLNHLLILFRGQTASNQVKGLAAQVLLKDVDSLIDQQNL